MPPREWEVGADQGGYSKVLGPDQGGYSKVPGLDQGGYSKVPGPDQSNQSSYSKVLGVDQSGYSKVPVSAADSLLSMAVRKARKVIGLDCFSCVLCGHPRPHKPAIAVSSKEKEISNHVGQGGTPSPHSATSPAGLASQPSGDVIKPAPPPGVRDTNSSKYSGDDIRGLQPSAHDASSPSNRKQVARDADFQQPLQPHPRLQDAAADGKTGGGGGKLTPADVRENKENKPKKRAAVNGSGAAVGVGNTPGSRSSAAASGGGVASSHIPPFYFPRGRPGQVPAGEAEAVMQRLAAEFATLDGGKAYKQQMAPITKTCGLPMYWKILLFRAAGGATEGYVTYQSLSTLLKKMFQNCHDEASKFLRLAAKPGSSVLEFEDFDPLVQDVVETHPGLTFLQDAPEFHSRYVTTVISRILFCVNRSWSGRISLPELRKSNFLQTVSRLEVEEDINQVKDFFSYEHFYVIYCKFWELDKDHDLFIDKNDLSRHNDHALNSRLIDRIFSGAVTRGQDFQEGRMSYREFVWFLLAEEDKKHPTSVEYWFRCMDLDGDGVISMYEMEFFHEEQMNKMETLGIERLPFEDTVCQMMDMVCPKNQGRILLSDLKACKMTSIFFDTFFNLDKFLEHEQRDPFANARDPNAEPMEVSDWNRYAEEEYDILVADEGNADMDDGNYEDDFEPEDDDEILREEMLRLADAGPSQRGSPGQSLTAEDIYDFSGTTNLGY